MIRLIQFLLRWLTPYISHYYNLMIRLLFLFLIITLRNEVAKVMFLHVSVILFTGGWWYPSMHCRWYPSMPCSRGVCYPSMPCSRGCLLLGGLLWGACSWEGVETPPRSRRPPLRTVHVLLECILVILNL